jgi:Ohr subfamily peroxiredoxin
LNAPSVSLLDTYHGDTVLPLYSTSVTVSGGEIRHARASSRAFSDDGELDVLLRLPRPLGGGGGGTNPEQLFAAGYGACFHGAMSLVAAKRRMKLPSDIEIKVQVTFGRDPEDGLFLLTAELEVGLPALDAAAADALIEEAEKICPYAKMARRGIQSSVKRVLLSDPPAPT